MDTFEQKKRPLSAVPENLEALSKPELIKIIRGLQKAQKKQRTGEAAVDAKAIQAMHKRLRDKVVKAVKKTAHNDRRKPYSEVSAGCASKSIAVALMGGRHPTSDTARMTRWVLAGDAVARFLGIERLVHPVKFEGKVWSFGGAPVRVYAWAAFESLDVKFENASKVLTVKARTFMAGSGRPEAAPRLVAYAKGAAGGLIGPALEEAQITDMMVNKPGYEDD